MIDLTPRRALDGDDLLFVDLNGGRDHLSPKLGRDVADDRANLFRSGREAEGDVDRGRKAKPRAETTPAVAALLRLCEHALELSLDPKLGNRRLQLPARMDERNRLVEPRSRKHFELAASLIDRVAANIDSGDRDGWRDVAVHRPSEVQRSHDHPDHNGGDDTSSHLHGRAVRPVALPFTNLHGHDPLLRGLYDERSSANPPL